MLGHPPPSNESNSSQCILLKWAQVHPRSVIVQIFTPASEALVSNADNVASHSRRFLLARLECKTIHDVESIS